MFSISSAAAAWLTSLTLLLSAAARAQSEPPLPANSSLSTISQELELPWAIEPLPAPWSQWALVSEKAGGLKQVNLDTGEQISVADLSDKVRVLGQGGLMDIALAPDFDRSGTVFFSYSHGVNPHQAATALARATLDPDKHTLSDWRTVMVTDSASSKGRHFGSRISLDPAGFLYFSVGDRGEREQAQSLGNHTGSILRLALDGSVPASNPFYPQTGDNRPEIYSYGHRNPQGLYFDTQHQALYAIEHGPRGGDEINRIKPGANYGWPVISYGKEYWGPISVGEGTHKDGMEQPLYQYTPSIAPSSLIRCPSSPWPKQLLAGSLVQQHLNVIELSADGQQVLSESRQLSSLGERIRDLGCHPERGLLLVTDSGKLLQLQHQLAQPAS